MCRRSKLNTHLAKSNTWFSSISSFAMYTFLQIAPPKSSITSASSVFATATSSSQQYLKENDCTSPRCLLIDISLIPIARSLAQVSSQSSSNIHSCVVCPSLPSFKRRLCISQVWVIRTVCRERNSVPILPSGKSNHAKVSHKCRRAEEQHESIFFSFMGCSQNANLLVYQRELSACCLQL